MSGEEEEDYNPSSNVANEDEDQPPQDEEQSTEKDSKEQSNEQSNEDDSNTSSTSEKKELTGVEAWKQFGEKILTLFVETLIISILSVNVLFFVDPMSIRQNGVFIKHLFPFDVHEWPYCYSEEFVECNSSCSKSTNRFGGLLQNVDPEDTFKKAFYTGMEEIDSWIFKLACVDRAKVEEVKKSIETTEDIRTFVNLGNFDLLKVRFKEWINNNYVLTFSLTRFFTFKFLGLYTKLFQKIPVDLVNYLSPLMFLTAPFVVFLMILYFSMGGTALVSFVCMILNKNEKEDKKFQSLGGIIWTIITMALGFGAIIPVIPWVVQLIQYIGTFVIYPLLHGDNYRNLYYKYVPIIFFVFNIGLLVHAFNTLEIEIAATFCGVLFLFYFITYRTGILNAWDAINSKVFKGKA